MIEFEFFFDNGHQGYSHCYTLDVDTSKDFSEVLDEIVDKATRQEKKRLGSAAGKVVGIWLSSYELEYQIEQGNAWRTSFDEIEALAGQEWVENYWIDREGLEAHYKKKGE